MRTGDHARDGAGAETVDGREVGRESSGARIIVRTGPGAADGEAAGTADTAISAPMGQEDAGLQTEPTVEVSNGTTTVVITSKPGGPDPLLGETLLDRYKVTARIGQGGMGAVYEATHTLIGKRVAVKVLLDKYAQKDQVVARLEQEARLASSIGHEHIIDITDFGETRDGRTFVVMEYLDGQSLAECLNQDGPLPEARAIRIAYQVASALSAAHDKGILHRDIKPENVFLLRRKGEDFVKVVDFGISKSLRTGEDGADVSPRLTQTGMVLGTPLYMSPEQARGDDDLDPRIDVYALGVILYEMVTGEVPFRGNNYLNIIARVLNDEPRPPRELRPDLSPELEAVILRALAKDRDERYPSCEVLGADLLVLLEDPGRATGRQRIKFTARSSRPRGTRAGLHPLAWIAGIAVITGAVVLSVRALLPGAEPGTGPGVVPGVLTVAPQAVASMAERDAGVAAAAAAASADAGPRRTVELATIEIESTPAGATIYNGGRVLGKTPLPLTLPKENRSIELIAELEGHDDASFTVNPFLDDGSSVPLRLKKPKRGTHAVKLPKAPTSTPADKATTPVPQRSGTAGGELSGNPYKRTTP